MYPKKLLSTALLFALPALGAFGTTGCVDNIDMVYIHTMMDTSSCTVTFTPDQAFISEGAIDLAVGDTFVAAILIGNQMTPLGNQNSLRAETSRFLIKGMEVHVLSGDLGSELKAFTTVAAGTVSPSSGGTDPGWGGIFATIVPPGLPLQAGKRYVSRIRIFGTTLAGAELQTGWFDFPINVTKGGLAKGIDVNGSCIDPTDPEKFCDEYPTDQQKYNCKYCAKDAAGVPNCYN